MRVFLLAVVLTFASAAQELVTVQTENGPVTGRRTQGVTTFLGIPFAAPPVGALRWKAPQPVTSWSGALDASRLPNECTQVVTALFDVPGEEKGEVKGSEDCLYLNVYVPPKATPATRLATMVWLHGGGFELGAGSQYDGSVLAQKQGVVRVTLNYRLGPLGFLALASLNAGSPDGSSGNYGLMDQQAALRWVKKNIGAFGGESRNVTLFGESAGGMSVCAQLASPASDGLFQKAIIQSGLCGSPNNTIMARDAAKRNAAYASTLGCKAASMDCLRALDASKITAGSVPGRRPLGNLIWSPVYGTPLLPLPLQAAFEQGKFHRVPILNGTNHDEGRLFVTIASPGSKPLLLHQYWIATGLVVGARKNRQVLSQYPYKADGTPAAAFATMFTDGMFSCPALRSDNALSKHTPVYAFEFNDPQAVTQIKIPPGLTSLGAFHSSGLVYIFQTPIVGLADPAEFNTAQRELSDAFSASWANFARTGNPNASGARWRPFDARRKNVQIFAPGGIRESTGYAAHHKCGFWSDLGLQ